MQGPEYAPPDMGKRSVGASTAPAPRVAGAVTPATTATYFPCFEGLRALAASLVVVHHAVALAGPSRAPTFVTPAAVMDLGVAIFFVLSGFLIYRPFARAHIDGTPTTPLGTYLRRRIVRIVPAYWLALSVFWALGVIDLGPWSRAWRFYTFVHIYDAQLIFEGIVQAWSLGTEMAFYLLVPVWAAVVARFAGRRPGAAALSAELVGVAVLIAAGYFSRAAFSASDRIWSEPDVTMRAVSFTWLPNNIDLFALGMGVAVVSLGVERGLLRRSLAEGAGRWPALWWGGALALFAWYAYRVGPPPFRVGHVGFTWQQRQLVFGAIGVALLVPAVFGDQGAGLIRRTLRWPPVVAVGMVSYGLYLWHNDWMKEVPGWLDTPPGATNLAMLLAVGFGAGLACAAVSYFALERPLQRWQKRR